VSALPPRGPRLREHGLRVGVYEAGPENAVTDVPGVAVGHVTIWRDEPDPPAGRGTGRSGVTAIVPGDPSTLVRRPVPAGTDVLNGAGELTSSIAIREWGVIETPVYLTATMAVGRVYDGAVRSAIAADSSVGVENFVIPVVGECDDGWLSEARVVQVEAEDVARALAEARSGPVAEGAVGAGTGMVAFGYKAGIGTASRVLPELGATLGVLVLANFGVRHDLVVAGVPVGELLGGEGAREDGDGSCIAVVVTDVQLGPHELTRIARRCGLGLARTGSVAYDGSGEIFLALSTGGRIERRAGGAREVASPRALNQLFLATVEATEEAVLNALWAAPDVVGREGRLAPGIPHEDVLELLRAHGRLPR
jgi:D-aminopeptidase